MACIDHLYFDSHDPWTRPRGTLVIGLTPLQGHRRITEFHLVDLAARHGAVLATCGARLVTSLAPADREHVELVPV